ncbi:MAG: hypothetical protein ACI956_002448, partial [Nonlabens sp.]
MRNQGNPYLPSSNFNPTAGPDSSKSLPPTRKEV